MHTRTAPLPGLTLFSVLSSCDLICTLLLLQWPNGRFRECNPIADAWLHRYGMTGLVFYKAAAALFFIGMAVYISHTEPRKAGRLISIGCLLVGCVFAYSYYLVQVETF